MNLYTNDVTTEITCKVLLHDISDHLPFIFHIPFSSKKKKCEKIKIRNFKKFIAESFLEDLDEAFKNSRVSLNNLNIHEHFHRFKSVFSDILNKHAPTRLQTRKKSKWQKKPWLNKAIRVSIRKKNELFAYQLKNPRDEMAVDLYKAYRNKLTHIEEILKKMYCKSVIDENKSHRLWKVINEIIRKERKQTSNIPNEVIDANGHKQTDSATVSNAFNQYFSVVGSRLASKIPPTSKPLRPILKVFLTLCF